MNEATKKAVEACKAFIESPESCEAIDGLFEAVMDLPLPSATGAIGSVIVGTEWLRSIEDVTAPKRQVRKLP